MVMKLLQEIAGSKQLDEGKAPGPTAAYEFVKEFGGAIKLRNRLAELLVAQGIAKDDPDFNKHLKAAAENLAWQIEP